MVTRAHLTALWVCGWSGPLIVHLRSLYRVRSCYFYNDGLKTEKPGSSADFEKEAALRTFSRRKNWLYKSVIII